MNIEWRPEAEADRDDIVNYISSDNPIAARQILVELLIAVDSLADLPYRGRSGRISGTRELLAIQPYVIVYEIAETSQLVRILRIWYAAQDR